MEAVAGPGYAMNYRHIEVFFAVMTCGTVTEAARQLGVSQPSVTTTIQQAEAGLGLRLFRREGGRLVPTAEARALFDEAERAHDALSAFRALARQLLSGQGGHLRIAAVPSLSLELLPDAIARFQQEHSGYNFSVTTLNTEEILQQLDARVGTFHLGFTFGAVDDAGFEPQWIGDAPLYAVLPADWDIPPDPELSLTRLAGLPYISGFDSTPSGQLCRNLFVDADIEPRTVAMIHTHHLAGRLVQRGMGYALLDAITVRALLHDRLARQVAVRRIEGEPSLPVTAMFQARRTLDNRAERLVECFRAAFRELEAEHEDRLP
jgi:DNA-binding transcriptional LysR family regulator